MSGVYYSFAICHSEPSAFSHSEGHCPEESHAQGRLW
jgi:hypothetical protein